MLHQVGQFRIYASGYTPPFTQNRIVRSFWDDVLLSIRVFVYEPTGEEVQEVTSGPTFTSPDGRGRLFEIKNSGYKFCGDATYNQPGPDLVEYFIDNSGTASNVILIYPYTRRTRSANHWSCSLISCDILFDTNITSVLPDSGGGSGSITVLANTSYGQPRYTRNPNHSYADASPSTTGPFTFSGLSAGTYTIYAIDQYECRAQITVIVPGTAAQYGTRWRLEYSDFFQKGETRLDIEEKHYSGAITQVCGGADPVVISWASNSIDDEMPTSECVIQLLSETDFQFIDLFTSDDRKYRVKYYRNGSLKWVGFVIPMLYSEPFHTTKNYIVQITASDQLGTLKDIDFVDDFGNVITTPMSFLDAITMILRKTDIDIPVLESVNIFEKSMGVSFVNFQNASFDGGTIFPWINISIGITGYPFQWMAGNIAESDPPGGSYDGAPALSQQRSNGDNWPVGDYKLAINISQAGATNGIGINLYGFDDVGGGGRVNFGSIGTKNEGSVESITGVVNVHTEKKFLGIGFVRFGPSGLHTIQVLDINIIEGPAISLNSSIQQAFFDPLVYYDKDGLPNRCDYVLRMLLRSWFARLYQSDGRWNIELVEEKTANTPYRIFDLTGQLQGHGNIFPIATITKPEGETFFVHARQRLNIPAFVNRVIFKLRNFYENNLLTRGKFYRNDVIGDQIIGWSFDISNAPGVVYGYQTRSENKQDNVIVNTRRFQQLSIANRRQITTDIRSEIVGIEDGSLFIDFNNTQSGAVILLSAEQFTLAPITGKDLKFKFDTLFLPYFSGFFYYIDVSIRIGDKYVVPGRVPQVSVTSLLVDDEYMRFYSETPLQWQTITQDIFSVFRGASVTLEGPVIVKIRINNHPAHDFDSIDALKAFTTAGENYLKIFDFKVNVLDTDVNTIRIYEISNGVDTESLPEIIRPNDFNSITNRTVWRLKKSMRVPDTDFLLSGIVLDEISLSFNEDVRDLTYQKSFNDEIRIDIEKDIIHSDIAIYADDIENPDNSNDNDARLVKNYIRYNNGIPTRRWGRSYVEGFISEPLSIQALSLWVNEDDGGTDWTLGSAPSVDIVTVGKSNLIVGELSNAFLGRSYNITIDFDLMGAGTIIFAMTIQASLLDDSLNIISYSRKNYVAINEDINGNKVATFVLNATDVNPSYLAISIPSAGISFSPGDEFTITLNSVTIVEEAVANGESYSLLELLMRMYQGQFAYPKYQLNGAFTSLNAELSFFNIFYHPLLSKYFSPVSLSLNDKMQILDGDLIEIRTGEDGVPPADVYEFTEEFTNEFNA